MAVSKKQNTVSRYFRTSKANVNLPHRPLICGETIKQEGPAHHFCTKEKCKLSVQIVLPAKPVQEIEVVPEAFIEPSLEPLSIEPLFSKPSLDPSVERFIKLLGEPSIKLFSERTIDQILDQIFEMATPTKQERFARTPIKSILKSPTPIGGFKILKQVKKNIRGANLKDISLQHLARGGGLRSLPEGGSSVPSPPLPSTSFHPLYSLHLCFFSITQHAYNNTGTEPEQTAKSALHSYLSSILRTVAANAEQKGRTIVTGSDIIAVLRTLSIVECGFN